MIDYKIYIEIKGSQVPVGDIVGENVETAGFRYYDEYLEKEEYKPISISLPFTDERYDSKRTRNFFEGLLPEGFTRKSVAGNLRVDADDYMSILYGLGQECLGAIRISSADEEELTYGYEKVSVKQLEELAAEGATTSTELVTKAHLSLAGASGKVGLYLDKAEEEWYLPLGLAASTHIVKQSHVRLRNLVTNEQLCMLTAKKLGLRSPKSFIIDTERPSDEEILFATERYDRYIDEESKIVDGLRVPYRLHQEDFSQALGIAPLDKYESEGDDYMRKAFTLLRDYSADPIEDQLMLWDKIVFDYLIGNTDNHIKNISLIYSKDMRSIRIAPVYDIVSTAIYDSCSKDMGMSIGGVLALKDIRRDDWIRQTQMIRLGSKMAMNRMDKMAEKFENALVESALELVDIGFTQALEIKESVLRCGGFKNL